MMVKFILNLRDPSNSLLAGRAAQYLAERPEQEDALLEFDDTYRFYVKRNKKSISVWEQ